MNPTLAHAPEMEGVRGLLRFAKDPLGSYEAVRKDRGSLIGYRQFGGDVRLLFEPALIEALLVHEADHVKKDFFVTQLKPILGLGLATNEGEPWRNQRKLLAPSFQPRQIRGYAATMVEATLDLMRSFRDGETRPLHVDMMHLTLEISVRTLFGGKSIRTHEVEVLMETAIADYRRLLMSWRAAFPRWFPFVARFRFHHVRKRLRHVINELIQQRRQEPLGDDMLSRLLEARDEEGGTMTDEQLLDEAVTVLLASHETTALSLTYTFYLLSQHPAVLARLREEASVLGRRRPSFEDVPALPYARAVIKEALRLYPPAWAMGREAERDFSLGDAAIRKGTTLIVVPWITHRDTRYFADPERFLPERWLALRPEDLPKGAYMPFGLGPRTCIGNHFAELETLLVVTTVLQEFDLVATRPGPLRLSPSVTLRPEGQVLMTVKRREARPRVPPTNETDAVRERPSGGA